MPKFIKFSDFSDSIYSFSNFNFSKNSTNKNGIKTAFEIIKKVVENELTERQKNCFVMYYEKNMNLSEISKKIGINSSTVWRHIQLAKKKITQIAKYYKNT